MSIYFSHPRKLFLRSSRYIDRSSNKFWMYAYKTYQCSFGCSDWSKCPYAHPGEKTIRRNPRHFNYSGDWCADFRSSFGKYCPRGNKCKFAHGYNEYWFHPSRYRTQICKYRKHCKKRSFCPFAHMPNQIRRPCSLSPTSEDKQPRWENLKEDCLVEVFQRIKVEELIYVVPFVCKSWYKASLKPDAWRYIDFQDFPVLTYHLPHIDQLIQGAVRRSGGTAIRVSLHSNCTTTALNYVANGCPALKFLHIPYSHEFDFDKHEQAVSQLICKWKHLEVLFLGRVGRWFKEILAQINIQCKNFVMLNLNHKGDTLKMILAGCKELELLDISSSACLTRIREDKELWNLVCRIKMFRCGDPERSQIEQTRIQGFSKPKLERSMNPIYSTFCRCLRLICGL